jgi:hypothetical protein
MTDYIGYRETIEYTIALPRDDHEAESFYGDSFGDAESVKSIVREVIERRHEPDYVIDCDNQRQVHILLADRAEVFAHRSHDSVIAKFRELSGYTGEIFPFDDLLDTGRSWYIDCDQPQLQPAT